MTAILAARMGQSVVMMADTRVCWFPSPSVMNFTDDAVKIVETGFGVVTGTGWAELLQDGKHRLAAAEIQGLNDVEHELQAAQQFWRRNHRSTHVSDTEVATMVCNTGWLMTLETSRARVLLLRAIGAPPKLVEVQGPACVALPPGNSVLQRDLEHRLVDVVHGVPADMPMSRAAVIVRSALASLLLEASSSCPEVGDGCTWACHIVGYGPIMGGPMPASELVTRG